MNATGDVLASAADGLVFVPLGGAGEIGMNLYLYGCRGKWLMVELGITFGDDTAPGIDVIMPDPQFIAELRDDLVGLVLTHAHEDHLGAVPYLWPRLRCPVFATPFAAGLLRRKLVEAGLAEEAKVTEVPLGGHIALDPFAIDLITLTHSIPESNALAIGTPFGTVLHTGDWKLDPRPLIGRVTDDQALRDLGEEGTLAMVCDSTNVFVDGEAGSEAEVRESLMELVGRYEKRVAVTFFSSNVARLETMAAVAAAHGRHAALIGRSLWRISETARSCGYLEDVPPFVSEYDVSYLPPEKVLLLCTGNQGEPASALARIAARDHPRVVLEEGDVALFSSRVIPGNEKAVYRLQNRLVELGVEVVTERDQFVHVSGHPARDDLARMYQWVRPRIAVPMHGEMRHLVEHAALARECRVPEARVVANGDVLKLAPGRAEVVSRVPYGRLGLDGTRLAPLEGSVVQARHRMIYNGTAAVTVVLDEAGKLLAEPRLSVQGLLDVEGDARDAVVLEEVIRTIEDALERLSKAARRDDATVAETVRLAVRRRLKASRGKKPLTEVHVVRI